MQSIFEFEEYESKTKYEGKYLYNKIYTHELFGKGPINSQVYPFLISIFYNNYKFNLIFKVSIP